VGQTNRDDTRPLRSNLPSRRSNLQQCGYIYCNSLLLISILSSVVAGSNGKFSFSLLWFAEMRGVAPLRRCSTLRMVHLIHRHGDRSPQYGCHSGCVRSDDETDFWNRRILSEELSNRLSSIFPPVDHRASEDLKCRTPFGDLTTRGSLQMFALGRKIRRYYWDALIQSKDEKSSLRVYSSNYRRTLQSAYCGLLGLFHDAPETESVNQSGSEHLNRLSFEMAMSALEEDRERWTEVLPRITIRERRKDVIDSFSRNMPQLPERVNELLRRDAEIYDRRETDMGLTPALQRDLANAMPGLRRPIVWFDLADALFCYKEHLLEADISEGKWPLSLDIVSKADMLHDYLTWRFVQYYNDAPLLRLATAHLLEEISKNSHEFMAGRRSERGLASETSPRRFIWMSGHDVTIMPVLRAVGAWNEKWAPYASFLAIELHETGDDNWEMRFVYNDKQVARMPLVDFEQKLRSVKGGRVPQGDSE